MKITMKFCTIAASAFMGYMFVRTNRRNAYKEETGGDLRRHLYPESLLYDLATKEAEASNPGKETPEVTLPQAEQALSQQDDSQESYDYWQLLVL